MKRLLLAILLLAAGAAQAQYTSPLRIPPLLGAVGTTLPSTCTVGELFFKSDAAAGQMTYECSAANTWSQNGGAPTGASYWTSTAEAGLSGETNLGGLTTGLILNTVTAGTAVPSAYAGTSCINQFPRSLNASGAATCASVAIGSDVSGLGTGVATWLATPSSANLAAAVTDETGSGALVFGTSPQISAIELGHASDTTLARASAGVLSVEGITLTRTIASGTAALGTSAIASGACATVVTSAGTGILTTDVLTASFNGDPTAVTGYAPSANGMLTIISYPTADTANFKVCNNTSASVTPGAITLNWRVVR